jgi:predicted lipase
VTICGHSLGGALATLLALDLAATAANPTNAAHAQFRNPTVFTYASPRTGDSMFAATYNLVVPNSNRIENRFDLVPHLPATWMGYQHVLAPWELTPDQHVKYDLYCEHSITTYLYLMSLQASSAVIPLENKCQATPPAQAQA